MHWKDFQVSVRPRLQQESSQAEHSSETSCFRGWEMNITDKENLNTSWGSMLKGDSMQDEQPHGHNHVLPQQP